MGWFDFLFKKEAVKKEEPCQCGSGREFENCHGLEFALPEHEKPDPD